MDSAPNLTTPNNLPTTSPTGGGDYFSTNLDQLEKAIEKFKTTGQFDSGEIDFAKNQILPQLGLNQNEIKEMGPVAVMVKLQELQAKGSLPTPDSTTVTNKSPISNGAEPTPAQGLSNKPDSTNSKTANLATNLSTADIEKLTKDLSDEIDEEIKKQMAQQHVLEQAQEKIDEVLADQVKPSETKPEVKETIVKEPTSTEPQQPAATSLPGDFNLSKKIEGHSEEKTEPTQTKKPLSPTKESEPNEALVNLDPLSASIEQAITNLKEGDKIGSEWILKKTLSTSFGNHKAPFYELENQAGAKWTLSPEEMRDVLRSELAPKKENKAPLPDLGPKQLETDKSKETSEETTKEIEGLATRTDIRPTGKIDFKKVAEKVRSVVGAPVEKTKSSSMAKPTEQKHDEKKPEIEQVRVKIEEPKTETKQEERPNPASSTHRDEPRTEPKKEEKEFETSTKVLQTGDLKLTQRQIDFLNKLHSDQTSWHTFTSFKPDEWGKLFTLYREGKLINLGIDAHPLIDRLHDSDFGETIDIRKGDTITKILDEAGYNLSWTNQDAQIIGTHVIANHQLLSDSRKKLEVSGLTVEQLPNEKEVIDLVHGAENGNHQSFYKLQETLQSLPINGKFKVIKPSLLDEIKTFFKH